MKTPAMSESRVRPTTSVRKSNEQEIFDKSWGREQRNIYLSKLDESFHRLADQPHLESARDDIRKGYRVYHVRRHLIFYRQKSTGIEIIRILHDRMDVETHLKRG